MIKVRVLQDFELFGRKYYAGQIIEVSKEVYIKIKDKVEKVK